jgi:DNA-binding transcriptional LysR family regulator
MLHTTQPSISNRIASLETELGVKLFERVPGPAPITLTAKGLELLPFAEKILLLQEEIKQRGMNQNKAAGIIRIGVSETIVHSWLPAFLQTLNIEMPNLEVELTVDVTSELSKALGARTIDLAFLMGPISEPTMINLPLCSFPLVWVAGAGLDLPDRLLDVGELAQWPILTYARNTKPFREISERLREESSKSVRFISSTSLAACFRLAVDNVGIATLPKSMVQQALARKVVTALDVVWTPSELNFTATYLKAPYNSLAEISARLAVRTASNYIDSDINEIIIGNSVVNNDLLV